MAQKNKIPGFLAILLVVLFIILLVAINFGKMMKNIQETAFLETVFKNKIKTVAEKPEKKRTSPPPVLADTIKIPPPEATASPLVNPEKITVDTPDITKVNPAVLIPETTPPADSNLPQATQPPQAVAPTATETGSQNIPTPVKTQETSLYFVVIGSDGTIIRKESKRKLPVSTSPMTDAIKTLLAGPERAEAEKGFMTAIPPGTQMLSATVRDGTAVLNFNESFEFNSYGSDGYNAQLMQIVFTATSFPTVQKVQFLIEGQRKEYLGSEGAWIGGPRTRDSFSFR